VVHEQAQPATGLASAADILIAIPTFNNEATIASVLKATRAALVQFPGQKALIAQFDGGSSDSTIERARTSLENEPAFLQISYPIHALHRFEASHHPVPEKTSACRTIFELADRIDAKACCIVGAESAGLTPDWIASLLQPVLDAGFDLVGPLYQRHKYDGLLVNGILYPLVRSLFGKRMRQPVGSDFGYSRALIRRCLDQEAWNAESARRDVDLWVSIQALQAGMNVCQAYLGPRRPARAATADVSSVLANLTGVACSEMERTAEQWQRIRGSSPIPSFGLRFDQEAEKSAVDVKPMLETFRIGYQNLHDIWGMVLPPAALLELKRMSRQSQDEFQYNDDFWARTVYDFALAHRLRKIGRDHLLGALTPIYMGWVASFILTVREMNFTQMEEEIEKLCMTFESQKPYLISRWRWPDRFMP
jgi:hypothetical protein